MNIFADAEFTALDDRMIAEGQIEPSSSEVFVSRSQFVDYRHFATWLFQVSHTSFSLVFRQFKHAWKMLHNQPLNQKHLIEAAQLEQGLDL